MPAATDQIVTSEALRSKLRSLVADPDFKLLLNAAMELMGPYRKQAGFQGEAHIQSMVSGGREAVDMFIANLIHIPDIAPPFEESTEYVSPNQIFNLI